MADVNVTISPALLSLPQRLLKTIERAHEQGARETVNELRSGIIEAGAVASFAGVRSIEKQFEDRGAIKAWLVGSALEYAPFAFEYGRKPGKQPPTDAIVKWIAQKPVDIGTQDIRRVAFVIARAIGRRGIRPRRIFTATTDKMLARVGEIFEKAIQEAIDQ